MILDLSLYFSLFDFLWSMQNKTSCSSLDTGSTITTETNTAGCQYTPSIVNVRSFHIKDIDEAVIILIQS